MLVAAVLVLSPFALLSTAPIVRPATTPSVRARPVIAVDLSAKPVDPVAAPEETAADPSPAAARGPLWPLAVLWRFTRPHTLIGSALCIPSLLAFAVPPRGALLSAPLAWAMLWALVPSLLINVYITGLN